jgi:hypothetical protein
MRQALADRPGVREQAMFGGYVVWIAAVNAR